VQGGVFRSGHVGCRKLEPRRPDRERIICAVFTPERALACVITCSTVSRTDLHRPAPQTTPLSLDRVRPSDSK
jgi:hypothetical protein